MLLIVPYGIETSYVATSLVPRMLLIVPYGIETPDVNQQLTRCSSLLIVPYGIETEYSANATANYIPFNCTLWN